MEATHMETKEAIWMAKAFTTQHLRKLLSTNQKRVNLCTSLSGLEYIEGQIVILRRAIMIAEAA
jgi:hypothetical protein